MTIVASNELSVSAERAPRLSWQESMRLAIRDAGVLCRRLNLADDIRQQAVAASKAFSVFAPLEYVGRMRSGDPNDPLLRQVLPCAEELSEPAGFTQDPLRESTVVASPGMLHKYEGRVLLVATGACAVHCRYCFRRHYPYRDSPSSMEQWQAALLRIEGDASIDEVLLSGGDPLTLTDPKLRELVGALSQIRHLRRLRIHTRLPIVIPRRVTEGLVRILRETRLSCLVVVHANHPREIGDDAADPVCQSLAKLIDHGIPVLNQAVLLRGVNDHVDVQEELNRRLVNQRVMPYYLHQLDRVAGASHFETPVSVGARMIDQLRERLPGYAVPRYVQELPGAASKTPLF